MSLFFPRHVFRADRACCRRHHWKGKRCGQRIDRNGCHRHLGFVVLCFDWSVGRIKSNAVSEMAGERQWQRLNILKIWKSGSLQESLRGRYIRFPGLVFLQRISAFGTRFAAPLFQLSRTLQKALNAVQTASSCSSLQSRTGLLEKCAHSCTSPLTLTTSREHSFKTFSMTLSALARC